MRTVITINGYGDRVDGFGNYLRGKGATVEHIAIMKKPRRMFQSKLEVVWLNAWAFLKLLPLSHKIMGSDVYCSGVQFAVLLVHRLMKSIGEGGEIVYTQFLPAFYGEQEVGETSVGIPS